MKPVNPLFLIRDEVTVVPNIRSVEESAGRNTITDGMAILYRENYQGYSGFVVDTDVQTYAGVSRNVYRVKFRQAKSLNLPFENCWFHEEWLYRKEEMPDTCNFDLDELLSEF